MKVYNLINSIINLTWLGVVVMILLLGTTLFTSFTHKEEKKEAICDVVAPKMSENLALGKALFKSNCAACHNRNMTSDLTGPALGGVTKRWSGYPTEDLYNWIRNSGKMIDEEHPKALEIWNKWDNSKMTSFLHLTDEDISNILEFIES